VGTTIIIHVKAILNYNNDHSFIYIILNVLHVLTCLILITARLLSLFNRGTEENAKAQNLLKKTKHVQDHTDINGRVGI